jgi:lipoate-protein ligase A
MAEEKFLQEVMEATRQRSTDVPTPPVSIDESLNAFLTSLQESFTRHAVRPHITSYSKPWWNDECRVAL